MTTPKPFPPAFSAAMHHYMSIEDQLGADHPDTKRAFIAAMALAPDWFMDDISRMGDEMDLLPQASGYLDDGSPVFSLEAIADKLGVSPEEAEKSFQEMVAVRQELGLPIDGVITDLGKVHRRQ